MPTGTEHLARLVEHLAWADERVLASLRSARAPLPAAVSLHAHVLGAEHVWLRRVSGGASEVAVWPELSLDECAELAHENVRGLRQLVSSLDSARRTTGESRMKATRLPFRFRTTEGWIPRWPSGRLNSQVSPASSVKANIEQLNVSEYNPSIIRLSVSMIGG